MLSMDWSNLEMVKAYATKCARRNGAQQSVILEPGATHYNIIVTSNEHKMQAGVIVVWRTGTFGSKK